MSPGRHSVLIEIKTGCWHQEGRRAILEGSPDVDRRWRYGCMEFASTFYDGHCKTRLRTTSRATLSRLPHLHEQTALGLSADRQSQPPRPGSPGLDKDREEETQSDPEDCGSAFVESANARRDGKFLPSGTAIAACAFDAL